MACIAPKNWTKNVCCNVLSQTFWMGKHINACFYVDTSLEVVAKSVVNVTLEFHDSTAGFVPFLPNSQQRFYSVTEATPITSFTRWCFPSFISSIITCHVYEVPKRGEKLPLLSRTCQHYSNFSFSSNCSFDSCIAAVLECCALYHGNGGAFQKNSPVGPRFSKCITVFWDALMANRAALSTTGWHLKVPAVEILLFNLADMLFILFKISHQHIGGGLLPWICRQ